MLGRLTQHINIRIEDSRKKEHWCLNWARDNFAQMSAVMVLYDHVKEDIQCLDNTTLLLKSIQNFVIFGEDEERMQGAYLYYDTNDEKWIRSGKVTGRSFLDRHKEHKKKASQSEATSRFYLRYPSVTKSNDMSYSRRGYFDNIKQCVALGLDIDMDKVPNSLTSDVNNGGIFAFTQKQQKRINNLNLRGRPNFKMKAVDMIAYLIELSYDLSISSVDNVSDNPGFESVIGVW